MRLKIPASIGNDDGDFMPRLKLVQKKYYERLDVEALCDEVRRGIHTSVDKGQAVILSVELLKSKLSENGGVLDLEEVQDLLHIITKETSLTTRILRDIRKLIDEEIERQSE